MKRTTRILAFVLMLMMVLPLASISTFAATEPAYGKLDANSFETGKTLTTADGFTLVAPFNKVVERDGRKVIRLPILCTDTANPKTTPTNRGQYFQIQHKAFSTTENTSIKVDLYMHGVSGNTPNIGIWLRKVNYKNTSGATATQDWYRLGDVNLLTGDFLVEKINGTKTGAAGLKKNAWNTVEFIFHPADGSFDIYVNNALYAKCAAPVVGTDFAVAANMLMYAVCSSNSTSNYTAAANAGENFANANYMDADDFIIDVAKAVEEEDPLEDGVHFLKDFEKMNAGDVPIFPEGSTSSPNKGSIVEVNGNKAWKIPFKGGASTADQININTNTYVNNPALSYNTNPKIVIEIKHWIPLDGIGVVDVRFNGNYCTFVKKDGTTVDNQKIAWLNLWRFDYNAADSKVRLLPGGANTGGSGEVPRGEWVTVSANIDMTAGKYEVYVNGQKAFDAAMIPQYHDGSTWVVGSGLKNLTIPANNLIVFSPNSACKTTANDTYMMLDDITIYDAEAIKITVDGKETEAYEGILFDAKQEGKQFIYAVVEHADGTKETVTNSQILAEEGMKITTYQVGLTTQKDAQFRLVNPTGIRFLTAVNTADLTALRNSADVKKVEIGTLITLQSYVEAAEGIFNPDLLEDYLDVAATLDAWYPNATVADCNVFAGSISHILEENYNEFFTALGYVTVTLQSGETVTVYAGNDACPIATYTGLAKALVSDSTLGKAERAHVEAVAAKYEVSEREEQVYGLKGLNVLSLGDSLFGGDYLDDNQTWLALLAKECDWNLTNLGRDGWTVCYNPSAYEAGATVRNSIYKHLAEDANYKYGSTSYYNTGNATSKTAKDVDLIILEGGVNDYGWGLPLGTVNDTDGSTVLGAWMEIVDMLLVKYPNAKIMFLTSWYVTGTNRNGEQRMDFVRNGLFELVETVYANEERVGILDGGNPDVTGVNMADAAFRAEYGKTGSPNDTNHLGAKGMELMAEGMLPLIWNAMKEHVENKDYTRIACIGDSITRNGYWKNNLYGYLDTSKYEVMGYGVNGATGYSKGIDQGSPKAYIDQPEYQDSLRYLPDAVVIMLGTNDTKPENYGPICADDGAQYIADIVALIRSYQNLVSSPVVYVALPATIFKDTAPIRNTPLEENIIPYLIRAAEATGAIIIDVHEATKDAGAHFSDKVHPSDDTGRMIIAQAVADAILENS